MERKVFVVVLCMMLFAPAAVAMEKAGMEQKAAQAMETTGEEAAPAMQEQAPEAVSLANLLAAYNASSNTTERYLAFAQKADAEGYKKAAALFRAAAKSEAIHAGFLLKNIKDMGATAQVDIMAPAVKSTRENLKEAVKDVSAVIQTTYPQYAERAKAEGASGALMAFGSGVKVKTSHKLLFEKALYNLQAWRTAPKGFYVCQVCGFTAEKLSFMECPVCKAPKTDFALVP